jgi:ribosome-interacting GTPase 1
VQPKGQITDFTAPVVLHDQSPTIEDFCNKLHKQLVSQLKYAWVWGSSVRHQPQKVRTAYTAEYLDFFLFTISTICEHFCCVPVVFFPSFCSVARNMF